LVEMIVPIFPANRAIICTREKPKRATLTVPQLFALYSGNRMGMVPLSCWASHARSDRAPAPETGTLAWQGGHFVPRCIPQSRGYTPCTPGGSFALGPCAAGNTAAQRGFAPCGAPCCAPHPYKGLVAPWYPRAAGMEEPRRRGFRTPELRKERRPCPQRQENTQSTSGRDGPSLSTLDLPTKRRRESPIGQRNSA